MKGTFFYRHAGPKGPEEPFFQKRFRRREAENPANPANTVNPDSDNERRGEGQALAMFRSNKHLF